MIKIKKSPNADSRTATHKVTISELFFNSKQHIEDVYNIMRWLSRNIIEIGLHHDHTKIHEIKDFYDSFEASQNGFQGNFKDLHWYKDHHLTERHHVLDKCPDDVNLLDLLEHIADIVAAGIARSGSVYDEEIPTELLVKAYNNTIKLVKDNIEVQE